jgi:hypothetical protein
MEMKILIICGCFFIPKTSKHQYNKRLENNQEN